MLRRACKYQRNATLGRRAFATGTQTIVFPIKSNFDFTHEVANQATPLSNVNFYHASPRYVSAIRKYAASETQAVHHHNLCAHYGAVAGSDNMLAAAHIANKHTPTFSAFDRYGRRGPGQAEFHPAYHALMAEAMGSRVPSLSWVEDNAVVPRCILTGLHYQLEQGTSCPLTMTFAGVAPLKRALAAAVEGSNLQKELSMWIDKLTSTRYDGHDAHISAKSGATIGMSMTEKQGGSDVRSNTTVATPMGGATVGTGNPNADPSYYTLRGHKWFTSAPMCDAFLTLAQVPKTETSEGGLSCFLVPRWLTPSEYNKGLQFQRLKEKMGDKSNASSEVEYHDAVGMLIGGVGKGVKTIIEMVNLTRLDCLNGSAALMQRGAMEASHHASRRTAFGARLIDQPLMRNVLSDLALECEAANALAMRIANGFNAVAAVNAASIVSSSSSSSNTTKAPSAEVVQEAHFSRLAVAISKYFVCKRAPAVIYEAMECLGGNGYTEDFPMARIFRQSPLNAIWEGSGNVIVLDVFRAAQKEKESVDALRFVLADLVKKDKRLVKAVMAVEESFKMPLGEQMMHGRRTVELMAKLLQASALHPAADSTSAAIPRTSDFVKRANVAAEEEKEAFIYDAFVSSRLLNNGDGHRLDLMGTLPSKFVSDTLVNRILPNK